MFMRARAMFYILLVVAMASSCTAQRSLPLDLPDPQMTLQPSPTSLPTLTPRPEPLGSPSNPLVMAVLAADPSPDQISAFTELGALMSADTGLSVTTRVMQSYIALETALQKGEVHLAWLGPVEYILASAKGLVESQLVSNHLGVTAYGVQFMANREVGLRSYYDTGTSKATAPAAIALAQLSGLKPCYTSPNSLTGYWVAAGYFKANNIPIEQPVLTQSSVGTIRALYVNKICNFGVTYGISADPRTSSEIIVEFPDALEKVPIFWISDPIIPNLNLSTHRSVDSAMRLAISEQLLQLSRQEAGKQLFSVGLNYETAGLQALPDSAYDTLRNLLSIQDTNLFSLVGLP